MFNDKFGIYPDIYTEYNSRQEAEECLKTLEGQYQSLRDQIKEYETEVERLENLKNTLPKRGFLDKMHEAGIFNYPKYHARTDDVEYVPIKTRDQAILAIDDRIDYFEGSFSEGEFPSPDKPSRIDYLEAEIHYAKEYIRTGILPNSESDLDSSA